VFAQRTISTAPVSKILFEPPSIEFSPQNSRESRSSRCCNRTWLDPNTVCPQIRCF